MKKCKNPQCLTEVSENEPDFCPVHNELNTTHQKNPVESWETRFTKEFRSKGLHLGYANDTLDKLLVFLRNDFAVDFIHSLLSSHHDQILAEILEEVKIKKKEKWAEMKRSCLELYPETAVMLTEEEIRSLLLAKERVELDKLIP